MRGVVIIAAGSTQYGQWAYNLAMGLKHTNPNTNISLLWKGSAKNHIEPYLSIFDEVIEIPDHCVMSNGVESLLRAKVCLYDLSPYSETIYIDADVIWFPFKQVDELFDRLTGLDFTMGCRSKNNLDDDPRLIWATAENLKSVFGEINVYNLSSEFIYFKKTKAVKEFFDAAQESFDNPGVDYTRFAGTVPDELAFQIAMIKTGIEPHQIPFLPFYWEHYHKKNLNVPEIYKKDYYGYSMGGNHNYPLQKQIYDNLAKFYAKTFGMKYAFLSANKRDIFNTRSKI